MKIKTIVTKLLSKVDLNIMIEENKNDDVNNRIVESIELENVVSITLLILTLEGGGGFGHFLQCFKSFSSSTTFSDYFFGYYCPPLFPVRPFLTAFPPRLNYITLNFGFDL